jgi:hypothetical protein
MSEVIIYIFCPSFYWYFKKNENSFFFIKNDHFYEEKCNFHFFKNTNKKKDKKYILLLQTLFSFFTFFKKKIKNKKGKSWTKIWQKSWAFNIFQHAIQAQRHNNQMKRTCHPVEFFRA